MQDISLTVFTPAYNRAHTLENLYASLIAQTDRRFVWHLVDDGSNDNTEALVRSWQSEGRLDIRYTRTSRHGKYVAHNLAVSYCDTELFVCVDSDDTLLPEAIERAKALWRVLRQDSHVCGIVSPRRIGRAAYRFPTDNRFGTLTQLYERHGYRGETMLVFRASILKRFLFPLIDGETFMMEHVLYGRLDAHYVLCYDNTMHYAMEYRDDGISRNIVAIRLASPNATRYALKCTAALRYPLQKRIKAYGEFLGMGHALRLHECFPEVGVPWPIRFLGRCVRAHYIALYNRKKEGTSPWK